MEKEIIKFLSEFSSLPEQEALSYFEGILKRSGFEVSRSHGIHALRGEDRKETLALSFSFLPETELEVGEGIIRGAGAQLNSSLAAALQHLPKNSRYNLEIIISPAGERKLPEVKADSALVIFPTELKIAIGQRGMEKLKIEIFTPGGSSAYPELGINALYKAIDAIERLRLLGIEVIGLSSSPKPWSLPERAEIIAEIWEEQGEESELKKKAYRALAGLECKFEVVEALKGFSLSESEDIIKELQKAVERYRRPELTHFRGASPAGYLHSKGVKAVIFGPGKPELGLSEREWVVINEVVEFADIMGEHLRE